MLQNNWENHLQIARTQNVGMLEEEGTNGVKDVVDTSIGVES